MRAQKIKGEIMATYSITLNDRTIAGKSLLQYLDNLGLKPQKATTRKNRLDRAIEDIAAGRFSSATDGADLIRQCLQ